MSAAGVPLGTFGLLSPTECEHHLNLYRDALEMSNGTVALFALPGKHCFASADPVQIRDRAMELSCGSQEVYIHTNLHSLKPGNHTQRGRIETATIAIGLAADIDARGPNRKKPAETLCPTVADARALVQEFAALYGPASAVIDSGHGCYPWLLFREPYEIQGVGNRDRLIAISRRFHDALHRLATAHGWTGAVDFCDPAKVLRLAGTMNAKDPDAPVAVRFESEDPARYNISDLEEILPSAVPSLFALRPVAADVDLVRATPPPERLIAALEKNHPLFGPTWRYQRTDLKDQSCSGYDMSLAGIGVACCLTDDQIAGLLVANRRRFPREKQDRGKNYVDYLTRTIAKARASQPDIKPNEPGCSANCLSEDTNAAPASPSSAIAECVPDGGAPATGPEPQPEGVADKNDVALATPPVAAPAPPVQGTPGSDLLVQVAITKKEVVKSVSDRLMARHHFARDAAERLFAYKDGIYVPCDFHVRRQTQILLEGAGLAGKWSSHHGREVVQYTMLRAKELWGEPPRHEINLLNGILDTRTGVLREHSPEFLSPIQIPVKYDPTAECPAWEKFTGEVFPEDSVDLAWEVMGDLITPDRSIQKAVLLVGEGGNGKGVFLGGAIAFVGLNNVSTVPLHKLESDRFAVSRLYGKLVNCCADLPSSDLESTSMFKALTGGDIITGERKYENSFDFKPYSRLLFSANHPPRSQDASKAFFDRWVVIPFDRSFRGTNRERPRSEIDAALADPKELSGVLNRALPALQRVRSRGAFTETASTKRAMSEMQQVTDPLAVWLDRETVSQPMAFVPCGNLLAEYNEECSRRGRPVTNATAFGMALRRLRPGIDVKRRGPKGDQRECYVGIGLKVNPEFSQDSDWVP